MSQLSRTQDQAQDRIEARLGALGVSQALLDLDSLRVSQAMRRHPDLSELLGPVIEDLQRVAQAVRAATVDLGEIWDDGQKRGWSA